MGGGRTCSVYLEDGWGDGGLLVVVLFGQSGSDVLRCGDRLWYAQPAKAQSLFDQFDLELANLIAAAMDLRDSANGAEVVARAALADVKRAQDGEDPNAGALATVAQEKITDANAARTAWEPAAISARGKVVALIGLAGSADKG